LRMSGRPGTEVGCACMMGICPAGGAGGWAGAGGAAGCVDGCSVGCCPKACDVIRRTLSIPTSTRFHRVDERVVIKHPPFIGARKAHWPSMLAKGANVKTCCTCGKCDTLTPEHSYPA